MNRRGFLKILGVAAPVVFVPKLITNVNWGARRPIEDLSYLPMTVKIPLLKPLTQPPILYGLDSESIMKAYEPSFFELTRKEYLHYQKTGILPKRQYLEVTTY